MFFKSLIVFLVLLATWAVMAHALRRGSSPILNTFLVILTVFSLAYYTSFGEYHIINKSHDSAFMQATGKNQKSTWFHWHEHYHYYIGAKYFPELGYYGLYETIALADSQSKNPMVHVNDVRDLSLSLATKTMPQALEHARTTYRPNFSEERWQEFKTDLEYMKLLAYDNWLDLGMFDAGFNPPPTWVLFGNTTANLLPIAEDWFDYPPTIDQSDLNSFLDVLLLVICAAFIFRSFGFLPFCAFIIVFGTSFISSSHWTGGAFLRFLWFFGLCIGLCMLKERKWALAGALLAFSTCMRIFPGVFALGAFIALLYYGKQNDDWRPVKQLTIGGLATGAVLFLLSLLAYGWGAWMEFWDNINVHKDIYFVAHIGFKRIVVFDDWVPNQSFWWAAGMIKFAEWNQALRASWDSQFWLYFPFMLIMIAGAIWAARRISVPEATLLIGGIIFFLFAIPANYYYVYFALIPPIIYAMGDKGLKDNLLLLAFFAMWAYISYVPNLSEDNIVYNYYTCWSILIFFIIWIGLRAIEVRGNAAQDFDEFVESRKALVKQLFTGK